MLKCLCPVANCCCRTLYLQLVGVCSRKRPFFNSAWIELNDTFLDAASVSKPRCNAVGVTPDCCIALLSGNENNCRYFILPSMRVYSRPCIPFRFTAKMYDICLSVFAAEVKCIT
jgi:hypothetical protein